MMMNPQILHRNKIDEARRKGAREGQLRVLNQLTEDQRKELKKSEILTYARRNKIPILPPQTSEKKNLISSNKASFSSAKENRSPASKEGGPTTPTSSSRISSKTNIGRRDSVEYRCLDHDWKNEYDSPSDKNVQNPL
jgi:hypothetical protein